jgi:MFS family permease
LISALVYALSGVAGAFAPDIWTLLASRALLGLASAGLATVSTVLMGDYYAREKRDRLIGWSAFLGGGGALVSLLAAGGLAELDWRAPFGLYLVGLVIFLIALPTIKEPERAATVTAAVAGGSVRNATGLFALTILISIVMYMGSVQGPFLFASRGIVSPSTQALIADGITIASMVSSYLFGILRPKLGFAGILVLLWVALGVGVVGMGVTDNLAMLIFFGVVSGFGSGFMAPLTQSSILNVVPAAAHSRAMGISFACIFIGLFIQPIILAPVRAALGIQTSFVWVGVAALIAAALTVIWRMSAGVTKGQPGVGNV